MCKAINQVCLFNALTHSLTCNIFRHCVYVGNLPTLTTKADVREAFKACGNVVKMDLFSDRGFGFVHFDNNNAKQKALSLKPEILGRRINRKKNTK